VLLRSSFGRSLLPKRVAAMHTTWKGERAAAPIDRFFLPVGAGDAERVHGVGVTLQPPRAEEVRCHRRGDAAHVMRPAARSRESGGVLSVLGRVAHLWTSSWLYWWSKQRHRRADASNQMNGSSSVHRRSKRKRWPGWRVYGPLQPDALVCT